MMIARKLCLQSCSHLRHSVLYVLRPLSFRKNDHSNFSFFDIRGIQPPPENVLDLPVGDLYDPKTRNIITPKTSPNCFVSERF